MGFHTIVKELRWIPPAAAAAPRNVSFSTQLSELMRRELHQNKQQEINCGANCLL